MIFFRVEIILNNSYVMIITQEFYFRGWLPAGLVINSKLLRSLPDEDVPVLQPLLNPAPGSSWPQYQPNPVFPITQATDQMAIILKDPIPESTLVMLPLGDWYGPGTPYMLAINTWYDGRVQLVSGGDVMAVRILMGTKHLVHSSEEREPGNLPDVCVGEMTCMILPGRSSRTALFADSSAQVAMNMYEYGMYPVLSGPSGSNPACVMRYLRIRNANLSGLAIAYETDEADSSRCYIRCSVSSGTVTPPEGAGKIHYYGLIPIPNDRVQPIYAAMETSIEQSMAGKNALFYPANSIALAVTADLDNEKMVNLN